jgi:hypothetical protein
METGGLFVRGCNDNTVELNGSWGELILFNIYNDCERNDTVTQLKMFTQMLSTPLSGNTESTKPVLWLNDFN